MAYVGRTPANAAIEADDLADNIVTTNKIADDAVTNPKVANENITINGTAVALGGSITIPGETKPTITSISPSTISNAATAITITGTNFVSIPQVEAISSTGVVTPADSISFSSSTSITATFTLATDGTYFIRIENNDGNAVRSSTALLTVSDAPTFTTAAGSLGTIAGNFSGTVATIAATSDSSVTFSETTNVLTNSSQANCSLNSSTGVITTTDFGGSSTTATTYNFTIRATDGEGQTADRNFSLTSSYGASGGAQFN